MTTGKTIARVLENPMDGGARKAAIHGVAEGRTRLSDFTFTFHFHVLEKEMATHSSVLAWRIPGTGEPGGLTSMGSHRVGHDWLDLAIAIAICLDSWTKHSRFLCNIALYSIGPCFYHQSHPQLGTVFALAPSLHSSWGYFSTAIQ